jgi:hypothetical protein
METATMTPRSFWTEQELLCEISRLQEMITAASGPGAPGSKFAVAYLKQVMRDRAQMLAALRQEREHGVRVH